MECRWCRNSRKKGNNTVFCMLFGIMVHVMHAGCKYFREKGEGNDTTGNRMDDPAAEARR